MVIVARDEAHDLPACLASASGADQLVVVDHGSRDETAEIARAGGARVIAGEGSLSAARAKGLARASADWVLSLDADERLPPGGMTAIRRAITGAPPHVGGFRLPIRTHLGDRFLRWGGYYPARRLRLFRREGARWTSARVHERIVVRGRVSRLEVPLEHWSFRDLAHARWKAARYAHLAALDLREVEGRIGPLRGPLRSAWCFCRAYLLRGGCLMGRVGLALAWIQAGAVWQKYRLARQSLPWIGEFCDSGASQSADRA